MGVGSKGTLYDTCSDVSVLRICNKSNDDDDDETYCKNCFDFEILHF